MYLVDSTNYFCLPALCERNTHFYLLHLVYVCIIKNIILRFSTLPERKVKNALNLRNESWKIMLEIIAAVNKAVNDFIWGVPAMVCIIGVGLLLSFRTRFLQIRKFPYAMRTTAGRRPDDFRLYDDLRQLGFHFLCGRAVLLRVLDHHRLGPLRLAFCGISVPHQ